MFTQARARSEQREETKENASHLALCVKFCLPTMYQSWQVICRSWPRVEPCLSDPLVDGGSARPITLNDTDGYVLLPSGLLVARDWD